MHDTSAAEAARLLEAAADARSRGASAVRRPAWYPIGLGLCTALALAGFALPGMATTGVVLGAIVLPLALEVEARRRTGGAPRPSYLEPPFRSTTLVAVPVGVAVAAASLVALKTTGVSWVVLPGAVVVGVGTAATARRIERLRGATSSSVRSQAERPRP